jgi:hypothetical protein
MNGRYLLKEGDLFTIQDNKKIPIYVIINLSLNLFNTNFYNLGLFIQ